MISPAPGGDLPKFRLDELLTELLSRADEVLQARDSLRHLLAANRAIMGELSLPSLLLQVVRSAQELAGARYAALGVIAADGSLEQFVHTGLTTEQVAAIGDPPRGSGLLGALIRHPEPIRLQRITDDPRSSGFPPNHPPMGSFLGVPIELRDAVYGNLYLAESVRGEFTEEDTQLVVALAGLAAVAIENARLYQESQRGQQWLQASTELTRRLLTNPSDGDMAEIAHQVREMADAAVVTVVLPAGPDLLRVVAAAGTGEEDLLGVEYDRAGSLLDSAMQAGTTLRFADAGDPALPPVHLDRIGAFGPVMVVPLVGTSTVRGGLMIGRLPGRRAFTVAELDMATTFAGHAAVALELADARSAQQRVGLLEERDRIARDLHDHVIQRLFATGLTVQGLQLSLPPDLQARAETVVDQIDDTIRQIRTTIFGLHQVDRELQLRGRVLALLDELAPALPGPVDVHFAGPVDTLADQTLADDVTAVVREALTNVSRHAQASTARLSVTAGGDGCTVVVSDDGQGMGESTRRSGLENLRRRAEKRGGTCTIRPGDPVGTTVEWTVPL